MPAEAQRKQDIAKSVHCHIGSHNYAGVRARCRGDNCPFPKRGPWKQAINERHISFSDWVSQLCPSFIKPPRQEGSLAKERYVRVQVNVSFQTATSRYLSHVAADKDCPWQRICEIAARPEQR